MRGERRSADIGGWCFSQNPSFRVDSQNGHPYIAAIAEAAARKRGGDQKQTTEKQKQFSLSGFQFPAVAEK
jgi:hypothetical protein